MNVWRERKGWRANRAFNESMRKMQKKEERKRNRKIYCKPQGEDLDAARLTLIAVLSHFTRSDYHHPPLFRDFNENFLFTMPKLLFSFYKQQRASFKKPQEENFHIIISFTTTNVFSKSREKRKPQQKKRRIL